MRQVRQYVAFADGSADNYTVKKFNSPASVGVCIGVRRRSHVELVSEMATAIGPGTNNVAELIAIRYAMEGLAEISGYNVRAVVFSDSRYAIHMIDGQYSNRPNTSNYDLVHKIKSLFNKFKNLQFQHVKGHSGVEGNELADWLADVARRRHWNYDRFKWAEQVKNRKFAVDITLDYVDKDGDIVRLPEYQHALRRPGTSSPLSYQTKLPI